MKALVNGLIRPSPCRQDDLGFFTETLVGGLVRLSLYRQDDLDFLPRHSSVASFVHPPHRKNDLNFDQGTRQWLGSSVPTISRMTQAFYQGTWQLGSSIPSIGSMTQIFYQGTRQWLGSFVPPIGRMTQAFLPRHSFVGQFRPHYRQEDLYF